MQALIYTRVSQDRAHGRSPAEQEAEARTLCEREGWTVAEVVTDTKGASRYSKGSRTGWLQVEKRLASGNVDVLVTWECSRAQRDLAAYAELRDLCVAHGVLWSYSGRTHDLSTADDRFKTGLDALLAEREVDQSRERILRAMRANAAAGRPHGRRLYGYQRIYDPTTGVLVGQEPHPTEADVVRRIFADYLAGNGLRTIARALNAEGFTTGTGSQWTDSQVRRVLINQSYIARRTHRGQVISTGDWPPLVTPDEFEAVAARLHATVTARTRVTPTARLLTGVARCGVCGTKLFVGHDRQVRKVYTCRNGFHVARDQNKLDAFVSAVVLEHIEQALKTAAPSVASDPHRPAIAEAEQQLAEYRQAAIDGTISAASFAAIEAGLLAKITQHEKALRESVVPLSIDIPAGPLDDWWETRSAAQRRAVIGAWVEVVRVLKLPKQGGRTFNPDGVEVVLRRP